MIIDDSGSTGGSVSLRQKEAAFAVVAAARSYADPVGLVVFGSEVTLSLEQTTDSWLTDENKPLIQAKETKRFPILIPV